MRHIRFVLTLATLLVVPGWMPVQAEEAAGATSEEPARLERCEAPTGSRISPARDARGECPRIAGAGQVFDEEDLQRTGRTDLGEALQQLSPTISRGL